MIRIAPFSLFAIGPVQCVFHLLSACRLRLLNVGTTGCYQPQASSVRNWLSCRWNPGSSLIW